jgi:hypothetical protein
VYVPTLPELSTVAVNQDSEALQMLKERKMKNIKNRVDNNLLLDAKLAVLITIILTD